MRADGTDQHLYNGRLQPPTHKPVFSPDGTKILFGCCRELFSATISA
jgi:hypothetical protein